MCVRCVFLPEGPPRLRLGGGECDGVYRDSGSLSSHASDTYCPVAVIKDTGDVVHVPNAKLWRWAVALAPHMRRGQRRGGNQACAMRGRSSVCWVARAPVKQVLGLRLLPTPPGRPLLPANLIAHGKLQTHPSRSAPLLNLTRSGKRTELTRLEIDTDAPARRGPWFWIAHGQGSASRRDSGRQCARCPGAVLPTNTLELAVIHALLQGPQPVPCLCKQVA